MPSSILARADALMQRQRPNADGDIPVLTDAISSAGADGDIPLLLDVATAPPPPPPKPAAPPAKPVTPPPPAAVPPKPGPPPPPATPVAAAPLLPDLPEMTIPPDPQPRDSKPFVFREPVTAAATAAAETTAPPSASREDIARRVEQRLATELPRLVAAAVADYLAGRP
ncbi:MAG: hypothetical protein LBE62_02585 [Azonexus sp.]|jgi:hypothetical protein|nr:hypothetical protein [Azonexus sp.]